MRDPVDILLTLEFEAYYGPKREAITIAIPSRQ